MDMGEAQQAVRDHLLRREDPGTSRAFAVADPATISFRKSRSFPSCLLHAVTYVGGLGIEVAAVIRTRPDGDRSWLVHSMGGGGTDGPSPPRPWFNFAGGFSAHEFAAGGEVVGRGSDDAQVVRFTFANGVTAEDTLDDGIGLFFAPDHVVPPARVEIFDERGATLADYGEFKGMTALG